MEAANPEWGLRSAQADHSAQNKFLPGWMDEAEKVSEGANTAGQDFRDRVGVFIPLQENLLTTTVNFHQPCHLYRVGVEPDEDEVEGYDNRGPACETNALGLRKTRGINSLPQDAHANQDTGLDDHMLGQGWAGDKGQRHSYGASGRVTKRTAPRRSVAAQAASGESGFIKIVPPTDNTKEPMEPTRKEISPGVVIYTTDYKNSSGNVVGKHYEVESNRAIEFTLDISGSRNMQVERRTTSSKFPHTAKCPFLRSPLRTAY